MTALFLALNAYVSYYDFRFKKIRNKHLLLLLAFLPYYSTFFDLRSFSYAALAYLFFSLAF